MPVFEAGMSQYNRGVGYCQDPLGRSPLVADAQSFIVLDTIADLRAYRFSASTFPDGQMVYVKGYYDVEDGGGGYFNYVRTGTATDNGGTLIVPDVGLGYFERILNGSDLTALMFGAKNDGLVSAIEESQAAIDWLGAQGGGTLRFTQGTYKLDDRLLIPYNNINISLDADTTLEVSGWEYPGGQSPFGNQLHFTGDNCSVVGLGESSLIQLVDGSDANGVGVLHKSRFFILGVTLDGGKESVTAIADDTFQSGISLINDTTQNPTGGYGNYKVINCTIRNWVQYGINAYGNRCSGIVQGCDIYDNGVASQALSVGAGIAMTRGVSHFQVIGGYIYQNKGKGIFQTSAGREALNYTISGVSVHDNGGAGISFTEESDFASVAGIGTDGVSILGCTISSNQGSGIVLGTYDNVGFLRNVALSGNVCRGNGVYGCLVQTNNDVTNRTSNVQGTDNVFNLNVDEGLALGASLDATVNFSENVIVGNNGGGAQILNSSAATVSLGFNSQSTIIPVTVAGDYTPLWTGSVSDPVLNNGTMTAHYVKVDKQVTANVRITMGAGTTYGSGVWSISLPFTISASARAVGVALLTDAGTGLTVAVAVGAASGTVVTIGPNGASSSVGPTVPFTWAVGDALEFSVTYATDQ